VCQTPIKSKAVFCQACHYAAHARCSTEAPAACETRAKLLNPPRSPLIDEGSPAQSPKPDAGFSGTPAKFSAAGSPKQPTKSAGGFEMFARKKSRRNYSDGVGASETTANAASKEENDAGSTAFNGDKPMGEDLTRPKKARNGSNDSSTKSTGDKFECVSSVASGASVSDESLPRKPPPTSRVHYLTDAESSRTAAGAVTPITSSERNASIAVSEVTPTYDDMRRRKRLSKTPSNTSKGGCLVQ
jgi:hypothetical protein